MSRSRRDSARRPCAWESTPCKWRRKRPGARRAFAESDLRSAYDAVKGLDDDMVGTLKSTGSQAKGVAKEEFGRLREHLAQGGGDTAVQVKATLETLARQMAAVAQASAKDVRPDAQVAGRRLGAVASGILRGLADALDKKAEA